MKFIGRQPREFCGIYKGHYIMVHFIQVVLQFYSLVIEILIGADDSYDRRSTTGYIFQLGSGPISWSNKKVKTLSLSSCEEKYRAAKEESKEVVWLPSLAWF